MKFVVVLCLIATAAVTARPAVEVLREDARVGHDGTFRFFYELSDGTQVIENGALKHIDADHAGEAVEGKFSFVADDGNQYSLTYTADENGFRPAGAHLPTPPPVPESVLKTLKYLEEHPYHQPAGRKY